MNILITGGTGFIGSALCEQLSAKGYHLTVLSRKSEQEAKKICGQDTKIINSLSEVTPADIVNVIINLAGEPIADARWSDERKARLCDSRHTITRDIVALIAKLKVKPDVFISGSAVGYYGDQGDTAVTEKTFPRKEFTHDLCAKWEAIATEAEAHTRVCLLRTGLVLGGSGGFLKKMWLPFKLGLGGKLGSGTQFMPWIHLDDMIGIIQHLIHNEQMRGPVNACAPNPVTNYTFTKSLGALLRRPTIFAVPAFSLKIMLGEMSRLLLTGQNALPKKLLDSGYEFRFTSLDDALSDVTEGKGYLY